MDKRVPVVTVTIHDCEVQTFSAGGKGGQNQNRRSSGVRIIHHPSGARGEGREHRTQPQNKKAAFKRMANSLEMQKWLRLEHAKRTGALEAAVDETMKSENLIIEYAESFE